MSPADRVKPLVAALLAATVAGTAQAVPALRGFGRCEKTDVVCGDVTEARFRTSSPAGAETVAGKFLYDLSFQEGVRFADGIWEIPGGNAYAVAFGGVTARVCAAPSRAALARFLAAHPDVAPVRSAACPAWMKRFEWGVYGLSGLDDMHQWMRKAGAKPGQLLDPREDLDFLARMDGMRFDVWLQLPQFDDSDGIPSPSEYWKIRAADDRGLPWSVRLYMPVDGYNWATRRFAEFLDRPAPWMMNGWLRYSTHLPHLSWYQSEPWRYMARQTQRLMAAFDNGRVRGWMHPAGELVHQPWYDMHADYSPAAAASWRAWLKAHGVTLAEANAMYSRREDAPLTDWAQVGVPEFATFAGLPGMTRDLAGTWLTSTNGSDWTSLEMPGNWDFLKLYGAYEKNDVNAARTVRRVFRRTFDCVPDGTKTYLYFFPMNPDPNVRHTVTLNGRAAEVGTWCGLDVTDALRTGANELSVTLTGGYWNGRIFLSTQPPAVYPNLGPARNRLYALWNDWRRETKAARCAEIFAAMRQRDPDAPIKFMAPLGFGTPITDRLMSDWGAFAHFTGEGTWFFPWYKRYGKLYGYPGTSELAGPYTTVEAANRATLRVFLAGLDMHEPVFLTQTYARNPPVRDWWLAHKPLLRRLGRQDIWGPQVLIYRRSVSLLDNFPAPCPAVGGTTRRVNSPYDWDLGRGTLQALGQSMLYLDDDGVADGKMYGHRLIVDCGNEVIPSERLAELEAWVREGGTFVAWPFTGRSTETAGDSWPIARLAGAHVAKARPLGGTVTLAREGAFFTRLAGRAFPDAGRAVDCRGNNLNDSSLELAPDDAAVAATYENGAPAVTVRRLGKGRVVWFGSAFWRDAADREGIWWPGAGETDFVAALLEAVGFDKPLVATDDARVWAQPYRSNDGASLVGIVCNFNAAGTNDVRVTLRTGVRPARVVVYAAGGVTAPAFDFADGVARVRLALPAQEAAVVQADAFGPAESVDYWWRENAEVWHELKPSVTAVDFARYDEGRWRNPTQDLKPGARFTGTRPAANWLADGFDDGAWTPCAIDALQFWGLPDGSPAWVRRTFDLADARWLEAGETHLVCAAWQGPNFVSRGRLYLNGVELTAGVRRHGFLRSEVSRLLKPRGNVFAFAFESPEDGNRFTGLNGAVYLTHRAPAARTLALGGLPTTLGVPADWHGRYRLVLHLSASRGKPPLGVSCRGRFMRKHHHDFGDTTDIDITDLVRFGEDNRLEPLDLHRPADGWGPVDARLDLYACEGAE